MTVVPAPGCGTSTGITGMTSGDVGEAETDLAPVWLCGRFLSMWIVEKNKEIGAINLEKQLP